MARQKIKYLYRGNVMTIDQLEAISPNSADCIRQRILRNWLVEDAVEIPAGQMTKHTIKPKGNKCGAESFYDCFECSLIDCVEVGVLKFLDEPDFISELIIEARKDA